MYQLYYTKEAAKQLKIVEKSVLKEKIEQMLELIKQAPWQNPPPFKKLRGAYLGAYSRRISLQHRLFYQVDEVGKRIKILGIWGHYDDN